MAISLKHNFQSAVADGGDTSLVRPSNWNAEHDLTLATARLIGRTSSGTGSAEEISVGTGLNLSSGSLAVSSTTPQVNSINTFTAAQVIETTDNSNPALRITQLGTADALRVEDETSPDSTPFVITAAGHAIAGYGQTLTLETVQTQFQSHTDVLAEGGYGGVDWGNTATGQVNWFGKSRGGSYGTYSVVQSGDTVGDFRFYGSDNSALIPTARIQVAIDGTPGTNDMPGRIAFYTTADGASTVTERFRIGNAGQWGIGGANYGSSGSVILSSGASAAPSWSTTIDVQTFNSSGTWTKPSGNFQYVKVQLWGGGGSGAKGANSVPGGGGGGGGYNEVILNYSSLSDTAVTIGSGGASVTANADGNAGGTTSFGTLVYAYGGGGGGVDGVAGGGGGGGGPFSAGVSSTSRTAGNGAGLAGNGGDGTSISGVNGENGTDGSFGGGGGGGSTNNSSDTNGAGGSSVYGGGGGGAGAVDSSPGPGAGGVSFYGGAGGAGAFDANNATAGTAPGGGGGGSETGNSGAGANGRAIITTYFASLI